MVLHNYFDSVPDGLVKIVGFIWLSFSVGFELYKVGDGLT